MSLLEYWFKEGEFPESVEANDVIEGVESNRRMTTFNHAAYIWLMERNFTRQAAEAYVNYIIYGNRKALVYEVQLFDVVASKARGTYTSIMEAIVTRGVNRAVGLMTDAFEFIRNRLRMGSIVNIRILLNEPTMDDAFLAHFYLIYAATANRVDIVQDLEQGLLRRVGPEHVSNMYRAIIVALFNGCFPVFDLLFRMCMTSIDERIRIDDIETTLINVCAEAGDVNAIRYLVEKGAQIIPKDGRVSAIAIAVEHENLQAVQFMVDHSLKNM